jgi:phospholipase/carboxylesterase
MNFSLNTIIIEPEKNIKIDNAIILLHGYGGDGKDISMLSLNWKRFLPNTIFLCPDGHEACSINPKGFQWFDLTKEEPDYILEQSLIAEQKLKKFIDEIKNEYYLKNYQICLSGFSQGCMMSINLGLTSNENFNCIVGFSGKIINKENLQKRKKSDTKFLLIHGEKDQVVPANSLLEAKDFLIRNKVEVETNMIKNCEHHIPIEASSLALKYIKNNFKI